MFGGDHETVTSLWERVVAGSSPVGVHMDPIAQLVERVNFPSHLYPTIYVIFAGDQKRVTSSNW